MQNTFRSLKSPVTYRLGSRDLHNISLNTCSIAFHYLFGNLISISLKQNQVSFKHGGKQFMVSFNDYFHRNIQ